jgi:hypothetical protein
MFTPFHHHYPSCAASVNQDPAILADLEPRAAGITELLSSSGGSSFSDGLYRLFHPAAIRSWTQTVESAFPAYRARIAVFGYDWLGRIFALDLRSTGAQWSVLMIEPGTGESFEIPASFADFHNIELVDYAADALSKPFFDEWIAGGGERPDLTECIGYRIPLFLGGSDTVENLERTDMDVYWHLHGQLLTKSEEAN